MSRRIVTDEDMERALDFLRDNAADIGEARRRLAEAESLVKRTEALLFLASTEKSVEARKASVRASEKWEQASVEHAIAAGEFEKMKALREAASAKIDAWRTEQSTMRALRL